MIRALLRVLLVPALVACGPAPEVERPTVESEDAAPASPRFIQQVTWSPDGSRLLYSEIDVEANETRLYLIDPDGSNRRQLTDGPRDIWGSWSPDGTRIAFASRTDGNEDIWVMNADGSGKLRLTDDPAKDSAPCWSPDGTTIAFTSEREGASRIFLMDADGSNPRRISAGPGTDYAPRWSPDGRGIAYYTNVASGVDHIHVMNADGSGSKKVADGFWPAWSPDGSRLIFPAHEGGLYVARADGSERRLMLRGDIVLAEWSPDGSRIAFVRVTWSGPEGWPSTSEIFLAAADGSEVQVTRR